MGDKTVVERLKEQEVDINSKAEIRGIAIEVKDNGDNTGTITVYKLQDSTNHIETLEIEGISSCQIEIKKQEVTIENSILIEHITKWVYNYLNKDTIEFMYYFVGGKYHDKTMTRREIEEISEGKTEDLTEVRKQGGTCHREELDNQPTVEGYLNPMYSHIEYGLIYLRYETQKVYNQLSR